MYARSGITVSVGCTMMAWLTAGLVAAPISAGMLEQRQLSDRVIALTTPKTELSGLPLDTSGATAPDASKPAAGAETEAPPGSRILIAEVRDFRDDDVTERELHRDLRRKISLLAEELTGYTFRETVIEREISWLRRQPGVNERHLRQETADPLTGETRVMRRVTLTIPPEVLESWTDRLRQLRAAWMNGLVFGVAATAVLWIFALLAMAGLDRWTGGYRRGWILLFGLTLSACATAGIWSYVYLTYHAA